MIVVDVDVSVAVVVAMVVAAAVFSPISGCYISRFCLVIRGDASINRGGREENGGFAVTFLFLKPNRGIVSVLVLFFIFCPNLT